MSFFLSVLGPIVTLLVIQGFEIFLIFLLILLKSSYMNCSYRMEDETIIIIIIIIIIWYMHNPVAVLENDSHKILWDFNIQTDHLIPARRPDLIIINKKKKKKKICKIVDFAVPADHRINLKKSEKKDKYLDLARELKSCGT